MASGSSPQARNASTAWFFTQYWARSMETSWVVLSISMSRSGKSGRPERSFVPRVNELMPRIIPSQKVRGARTSTGAYQRKM